ncbi:MAG: hypothetical protein JW984_08940 [Deltaproteobacteria bacterium]|uniref:Uncharacterized protein n=1 Tax=Candidatus Zymogenus saltonus TaxID=2844893 RepID=A0A9D8PPY2_9DELT|nr:hypothetical protein [Candidatus Zymogenus saltonus]
MRKVKYVNIAVIAALLLPAIFLSVTDVSAGEIASGYLYPGQSSPKYSFLAPTGRETITFYGPPGATFGVELRGRADNALGNYQLINSTSIVLTGGGQFYFIVYSINGQGNWSAYW